MRHAAKNVVIVLALLGAGFALAWLRFRPWLEQGGGSFSDGRSERTLSDVERLRYAVWDAAEPLAGDVNGPGAESHTSVSPDGRYVVFAGGERGVDADLFVGEVEGESVVNVRALAALCTPFDEVSPRFGAQHLYFASNRPGGAGGLDVWRAPFAHGLFGEPERLGGALATEFDDTDPAPRPGSALAGREELVIASSRASGGRTFDLFRALPVQADGAADFHVEPLALLNSPHDERDPAFAAGGVALVFASDRGASGADSDFDLYRAVRLSDGAFAPPEELASLNTPSDERAPDPSSDGFVLRFARDLGEGANDEVLVARSLELYRAPGDPIGWEELLLVVLLLLLALLAWAAKHWRAMDVVYRCFVVSVIAHLLLLWWFQRVHPEANVVELAREGPRVRVQLGERASDRLARRALGGDLAAERSVGESAPGESEPTRSPSSAAELALASNVVPATAAFERASAPAARTASETELDAEARRSASVDAATIEIADAAADQQVSTRAARSESFDAARDVASAAGAASAAERAREDVAQPQRERVGGEGLAELLDAREASAALANAAPSAVAPRGDELDRDGDARALDVAERGAAPRADDVALAGPVFDAPTRAASVAGETDLVAALGGAAFERETATAAPSRAETLADGGGAPAELAGGAEPQALAFAPATFARTEAESPGTLTPSAQPNARPTLDVALAEPDAGLVDARPAALVAADGGDTAVLAPAPQTFTRGGSSAAAPQRASAGASGALGGTDASAPAPLAFAAAPAPAPTHDTVAARSELDATPYRTRFGAAKDEALREHGGTAATEAAVARGLDYLVSIQRRDGSWSDPREVSDKYGLVGVGRTGLCVLAFLGAGHTPQSNTQHSAVVARAIQWLAARQLQSGHFGQSDAYSHGIATYALAEAYALTRDEALRAPIERAVAHVLANQRTSGGARNRGGWSYYRDSGPYFDEYARTSITSWQVMALESARLGGIDVPDAAFENAKRFLLAAWDEELGAFRYSHDPSRLASNWPTLPASTPAAMFALSLLGEDLASARYDDARQYVLTRATSQYRYRGDDAFVLRGQGNVYFSYYATLAMFRAGGGAWSEWNESLQPLFLESQHADGSWGPLSSYADYAGDDERDAAYSTAMAVLCLEVYYRYFTPLLAVELPGASSGAAPGATAPSDATEATETR